MTGKDLVDRYQEIWDEYDNTKINMPTPQNGDKLLERGFVFEFDEGLKDIDVLFVGINPSYSKGEPETRFYQKKDVEAFAYFKPFNAIIGELEKSSNNANEIVWSHLDMLVFRETQQSFIKDELLKSKESVDFLYKQIKVSQDILEYLNPKIMVVSNTAARHFLGRDKFNVKENDEEKEYGAWMGYDFEFDDDIGTDKIIHNDKIKPYVFFTSMLSGQRALDNGSKQRLIWHINRALNKINETK